MKWFQGHYLAIWFITRIFERNTGTILSSNSFVLIQEIGIEVFLKDILESAYFPVEAEIYNLRFILFSSEFWQRH